MKWVLLLNIFACALLQGNAQPQFFGPPPPQLNAFFASCFQQASTSVNVNWKSVTDFIILHASWYDNSNVGACAPSLGPDFTMEADCWKTAFSRLIPSSSAELGVAKFCVDRLVEVTSQREKRSTNDRPMIVGRSLDSMRCPDVDPDEFVRLVLSEVDPESLTAEDDTLQSLLSVIEFVKKAGTCNRPICNRCNTRYVSARNRREKLRCSHCWPTRFAGMIKNSSPLKIAVTQAATKLGNNLESSGPPSPNVNLFFANCIATLVQDNKNWLSITDYIILHSSWYENSNVGLCTLSEDLQQEARCWKRAFTKIISSSSPISEIVEVCVDQFVAHSRDLPPLNAPNLPNKPGRSLDSRSCPSVGLGRYKRLFDHKVNQTTIPTDFFTHDHTLQGLDSVISFVRESALCRRPTCNQCRVRYGFRSRSRGSPSCESCWTTRLAGIIKGSSPLKLPATFAAAFSVIKKH